MKEYFNTAFINRVDNILIFDRLEETAIREIILKRIEDIKIKYSSICIIIDNNVVNELIEKCNFYEFGARRVDKIISKYIENVIIDGIISGSSEVYINSIYNISLVKVIFFYSTVSFTYILLSSLCTTSL
ncbi:MAG: hypothetical protein L6V91_01610 [Bacilli bacterium]|nr:MAG: hypothetical protein L6V91_01610 [Bacilli bacterium]